MSRLIQSDFDMCNWLRLALNKLKENFPRVRNKIGHLVPPFVDFLNSDLISDDCVGSNFHPASLSRP
jgi:hypothetical protein